MSAAPASAVSAHKLFTIGYEAATQAALLDRLRAAGVGLVIDVRAVAASRKAGFSKSLLAASLAERGIGYAHLRALGTPKAGRDAVRHGDVAAMQRIFHDHLQAPEAQAALAHAAALAAERPACLLCYERDHTHCHRLLVADDLGAATGLKAVHLRTDDAGADAGIGA